MSSPNKATEATEAVRQMLNHAREAHAMAEHRSRTDLETDRIFWLCLTRLMEIVGEAAGRTPKEFRCQHPELDWRNIINLRNRLIHGFDKVDNDKLWAIVQDNLLELIGQLEAILESE